MPRVSSGGSDGSGEGNDPATPTEENAPPSPHPRSPGLRPDDDFVSSALLSRRHNNRTRMGLRTAGELLADAFDHEEVGAVLSWPPVVAVACRCCGLPIPRPVVTARPCSPSGRDPARVVPPGSRVDLRRSRGALVPGTRQSAAPCARQHGPRHVIADAPSTPISVSVPDSIPRCLHLVYFAADRLH